MAGGGGEQSEKPHEDCGIMAGDHVGGRCAVSTTAAGIEPGRTGEP